MIPEYYPQYRIVCPKCGASGTKNRVFEKTTGFLWWKKTGLYQMVDSADCNCPRCGAAFHIDLNSNHLENCYPTAVGIHPSELFKE